MNTPNIVFGIVLCIFSFSLTGMSKDLIVFSGQNTHIAYDLKEMAEKAGNNLLPEQKAHFAKIFEDFEIATIAAASPRASIALEEKTILEFIVLILKNGGEITATQETTARLITKHNEEGILLNGPLYDIGAAALVQATPSNPLCTIT